MKSPLGFLAGKILPLFAAFAALLATVPARANLLTSANETQLEAWLGQGDLDFTNIFTKVWGDGQNASAFHAAADGSGATFTLLETTDGKIIGGYNPDSWTSNTGWTMRLTEAERKAFIFNLTSGVRQHQNLNGQGWSGFYSSGDYETLNQSNYGSTWGGGYDLYVNSFMEYGTAYNFSYGGTSFGTNIVGGNGINSLFNIARYEVYTFSADPASVPDGAGTFGLITVSLAGLATLKRRALAMP